MATKVDAVAAGLPADHADKLEAIFPTIDWAGLIAIIKQYGFAVLAAILQLILTPAPAPKSVKAAACPDPEDCDHHDRCCDCLRSQLCALEHQLQAVRCCFAHLEDCDG